MNIIYLIMFAIGAVLIYTLRNSLIQLSSFSDFGIAAALTASYLWIRLDVWRSDKTVKDLAGPNKVTATDLISRRTDSRVALFLLILVAVAQAHQHLLAFGMLLVLVPVGNAIARSMEKRQLDKFTTR